jgi:CO/xanthine dehydrogenase Mo-binding subunit
LNLYTSDASAASGAHAGSGHAGLEENRMRVIAPEVGGGFGSKLNIYAEEALMGFVAMQIGKPVKWIESRRENFLTTIHGAGTWIISKSRRRTTAPFWASS